MSGVYPPSLSLLLIAKIPLPKASAIFMIPKPSVSNAKDLMIVIMLTGVPPKNGFLMEKINVVLVPVVELLTLAMFLSCVTWATPTKGKK